MDLLQLQRSILFNKDVLLKSFHAVVSLVIFVCIVSALLLIQITDIDLDKCEFLKHGFKYVFWLFSLWVSVFQVIYFNIYFAIDIIDIYAKQNPKLQLLKRQLHIIASYLLFMLVFPISPVISILFWTFYFWRREVMYPEIMDQLFPPILNHVLHTLPTFFAMIYMFIEKETAPPKSKTFKGLLALIVLYAVGLVGIRIRDGRWVYIAIESLTTFQKIWMLTFSVLGSFIFFHLGYIINEKMKGLREKINTALKQH